MRKKTAPVSKTRPAERIARAGKILGGILMFAALCLSALAQSSLEKELRAANDEWVRYYQAKNWPEALRVLQVQLDLADRLGDREVRAGVLYNFACVRALAGQKTLAIAAVRDAVAAGYTKYESFAADPDFDSLRGDPEFRSILADLKEKYGPRPLEWDRAQSLPPFEAVYDFPQTPELSELRREFSIDDVVAGAADEYDRLRRLTQWVSTRWQHSPNQTASKADPLTILREAQKGGRFICRDYAIVLAGTASAYGMPARVLNLMPRDVETRSEAHSVAEVWLESLKKWVLADGQFGAIGELDGVPLNGVELQAAFAADKPVKCGGGTAACAQWKPFILRNAYFFKFGNDQRAFNRAMTKQLVLIPKGAAEPKKFAGGNEEVFAGAVYISNPDVFYAAPARAAAKKP
jgi:hypothetical protein